MSDYWIGFWIGILSGITALFVLVAIVFVVAARAAKSLDESQWRDSQ